MTGTEFLRNRWQWVITFCAALHSAIIFGFLYNYSILFLSLKEEFQGSAALTGWVGSTANALSMLLSPISSLVLSRTRCRGGIGAFLGLMLCSSGCLLSSYATELWQLFLTFGIIVGFGANFNEFSKYVLLGKWFPGKFYCRASCIVGSALSIGMMIQSFLITSFISAYGWRNTLRLLSAIHLFTGILTVFCMRDPTPSRQLGKRRSSVEEEEMLNKDCGTEPRPLKDECEAETQAQDDNMTTSSFERKESIQHASEMKMLEAETTFTDTKTPNGCVVETHLARGKDDAENNLDDIISTSWCSMLGVADVWFWTLGITFASNALTFAVVNLASFADELGFSARQTSLVISVLGAAEFIGKVTLAIAGDHLPFGLIYIPIAASIAAAAISGLMTIVKTLPWLLVLACGFGVTRTGLSTICYAVPNQLFRHLYGLHLVTAIATIPYGAGALFASPIAGGLYDVTGDYTLSLLVVCGSFVTSAVFFILIPLRKKIQSLRSTRNVLSATP